MITEKEYLDAVRIVNDYTEQIRKKTTLPILDFTDSELVTLPISIKKEPFIFSPYSEEEIQLFSVKDSN